MYQRSIAFGFSLVLSFVFCFGIGAVQPTWAQTEATTPTKSVAIIPAEDQPELTVDSELQEPSANDTLDAAEAGTIRVTVTNRGGGPAREVEMWMKPETETQEVRLQDRPLSGTDSVEIGQISSLGASMSKTYTMPIQAAEVLSGTDIQLGVEVYEKNGFGLGTPYRVTIPTESYRPPALAVSGFDVKDVSEQKIQPEAVNEVTLQIENGGDGPARALRAKVEVVEGGELLANAGTAMELGTVRSGSSTPLTLELKAEPDAESVPLRVSLRSAEDPYETTDQVTLPVAAPDRPPLVDREIPSTNTTRENAIAVVVGVRNYQSSEVPNVEYAERDAKTMKKYLHKTLGFREGNILELINPTKTDLQRVFGTGQTHKGDLYDYLRSDTTEVFVFYSGHGAPNPEEDGRTYFVPSDGTPRQLSITGYSVNQLYENLSKITSGPVTVAVDACFSGQSEGGALVKNASPALLSVENPMVGMENGLVMTASEASEISSWYPEKKHGLFTYFLLKGFRGEADENQDGLLTGAEMKKYLGENVTYYARRLHSRTQNPQVMGQGADRVLVRYASRTSTDSPDQKQGNEQDQQTGASGDATDAGSNSGLN